MPQLDAKRTVNAPALFTLASLRSSFEERARRGPESFTLRFPLDWLSRGLAIVKMVSLRLGYTGDMDPQHRALRIQWTPSDDGLFPSFTGTVDATGDGDGPCVLEVHGTYTPPAGTLGAIIDAVAGARVAHATLAALLNDFANAVESDYRARTRMS